MVQTDQFIGKIRIIGGVNVITVPVRNMEFSGLKEGDMLKVWYKKKGDSDEQTTKKEEDLGE